MSKVAWYDTNAPQWLRDWLVILHPPYTLWHLSYVPMGAALARNLDWGLLGWTYLAFFLGMGIGGHCLDELNGRPLRTLIPEWLLLVVASASVGLAMAIGIVVSLYTTLWVLSTIVFGVFIVFAYNLELPRKRLIVPARFFHHDFWFAFSWGAFPAVTAYVVQEHRLSWALVLLAAFALLSSWAQRALSLHARFWRRRVARVDGWYLRYGDRPPAAPHPFTSADIIRPSETALKFLNAAVIVLSIALLLTHV